jgi:hypothetical protein
MVELNAEAFRRCRDLMIQSAIDFQTELKELIIDLEKSRSDLVRLRRDAQTKVTQAEKAQTEVAPLAASPSSPMISCDSLAGAAQPPLRGRNRSSIAMTVSVTSATKTKPSAWAISFSSIPSHPIHDCHARGMRPGDCNETVRTEQTGRPPQAGQLLRILPAGAKAGGMNARGRTERTRAL